MVKSLFIKTYGCQMNVYDSDRMAELLSPLGYGLCDEPKGADMVILNTCHIREKAAEKLFSDLGRIKPFKKAKTDKGEEMILAVAGCVAQAEGEEIIRRAPYVDMVFGPQAYHRLPEMVARATRQKGAVLDTDFPVESKFDHMPGSVPVQGGNAYLTIQEGCDKFCTFCVVPYTRGSEFSRTTNEVLVEAQLLADKGAREITLLGQNVNAYHGVTPEGDEWNLAKLIHAVAKIDGIDRIRYSTSYPAEVDEELIAAHRDVPELLPFLHLPVQSGSNRVLSAMNRRHDADQYRDLVARMRAARPDIKISSDFIVGFPGETEEDFEETMQLVRDLGFTQSYSFKYSPRPGTPAAAMTNQVKEIDKERRLEELQALLEAQQTEFNLSCIGTVMPVLLERRGRDDQQLVGRSPFMQPIRVAATLDLLGTIAMVEIEKAHANSNSGRIVTENPVSFDTANKQRTA